MDYTKPNFYPRGQTSGVHTWACMYCAHININQIRPDAFKLRCKKCEHIVWLGPAYHIPAGSATKKAYDEFIPIWADESYEFDPIKFDPMPVGVISPVPIKQRGRIAMVLIHSSYWHTTEPLPSSPEEALEYVRPEG